MINGKVNILHLSDLHFGVEKHEDIQDTAAARRRIALEALRKTLKELDKKWQPDIIVISGDIGWRSSQSDYKKAKKWITNLLTDLNLTTKELIMCVGNHDIKLKSTKGMPPPQSAEDADEWLEIENLEKYLTTFKPYIDFCENIGMPELRIGDFSSHIVGSREIHGIRFIVLNSAWFCRGKNDNGNLWIGLPHLISMKAESLLLTEDEHDTGKITIAVLHHPESFLNVVERKDYDRRPNAYRYLAKGCHIILSGHIHDSIDAPSKKEGQAYIYIGGATYSKRDYSNNFSILQININERRVIRKAFDFDSHNEKWKESNIKDGDIILKSGMGTRNSDELSSTSGITGPLTNQATPIKNPGDSVQDTIIENLNRFMSKAPEDTMSDNFTIETLKQTIYDSLGGFDPKSLKGKTLGRGKYKVKGIIDIGEGKGIVYKVEDNDEKEGNDEKKIKAIKLFPPRYQFSQKDIKRINDELNLAREIAHRNVVKTYGLEKDRDRGLSYIVMEYIEGENLGKYLETIPGNKLKEKETLSIMKQVASGLIEAHHNDVLHRDIKPHNIFLGKNGIVKILNFGQSCQLKKSIKEIDNETINTRTLAHMSPERIQKYRAKEDYWKDKDEQEDVWGFGVTMYQLLTGKYPFNTIEKIYDPNFIPKIGRVSKRTKAVILKCLERDKYKRYKDIEEVFNDLFEKKKKEPSIKKQGKQRVIHSPKNILLNHPYKSIMTIFLALLPLVLMGILIFRNSDDAYRMWYCGSTGPETISGCGIGFATSDNGINWSGYPGNPIITQGKKNSFNRMGSSFPYIVNDGKRLHMLFLGRENIEKTSRYQTGYATSTDGIKWEFFAGNPIKLGSGNIKKPGPIIYRNGHYHMWFGDGKDIYYARTKNPNSSLLDITRYGKTPILKRGENGDWDDKGIEIGSVLYENGIYKMWFTGKSEQSYRIGYATSYDGIKWQKYPHNPVFNDTTVTYEMRPAVVHDATEYKMYYTAATEGSGFYPVRLAISNDGIAWIKYSNDPILPGKKENWDKLFGTFVNFK